MPWKICPYGHTDMERPLSTGFLRFFILVFQSDLGCRRLRRRISLIFVDWSDGAEPEPTGKRFVESPAFYKRESGGRGRLSHGVPHRWLLSCLHRKVASISLTKSCLLFYPWAGLCFPVPAGIPQSDKRDLSSVFRASIRSLRTVRQGEELCVCCCNCRSIAHTKPASSRTTARIATGAALPRSVRCR